MTTKVEGQSESKPEVVTKQEIDVEAILKENQVLKASNERILNESKGYKAKFQETNARLESIEQEKLEKNGEFEVMLANERKKNSELLETLKSKDDRVIKQNVKLALNKVASDAQDINDLMGSQYSSLIQYDEDTLEVDMDSVQQAYAKAKEEKPYWFRSEAIAKQVSGMPKEDKPKTGMSKDEVNQIWKDFIN